MAAPPVIKDVTVARKRTRIAGPPEPTAKVLPGWPTETRNATGRERAAIRCALAGVVGADAAERLIEIADALPPEEPLPAPTGNAWTRAEALAETAEGRAKLKTLTWETV